MKTHITILVVALATSIGAAIGQTPAQIASINAKVTAGNYAAALAELDPLLTATEYDPQSQSPQNDLLRMKTSCLVHTQGKAAGYAFAVASKNYGDAARFAPTPQQTVIERARQLAQRPDDIYLKSLLLSARFSAGENANSDSAALLATSTGYLPPGTTFNLYRAFDPAKATSVELKAFYTELLKRTELTAQSAAVVGKIRDQLSKLP